MSFSFQDLLHVSHQGVACVYVPATVCDHLEDKHGDMTMQELDTILSTSVFQHYKEWCKSKKLTPCSSRFSCSRFGKTTWATPCELGSVYKAAVVREMIFWVAAYLEEEGARDELSACAFHMAMFESIIASNGRFLSEPAKTQAVSHMQNFLLFSQSLTGKDRRRRNGRRHYKLIPKHHSLVHLHEALAETGRNPRFDHCYMDEDLMRAVSAISSRTHPNTLERVTLERYRAYLTLCHAMDADLKEA